MLKKFVDIDLSESSSNDSSNNNSTFGMVGYISFSILLFKFYVRKQENSFQHLNQSVSLLLHGAILVFHMTGVLMKLSYHLNNLFAVRALLL